MSSADTPDRAQRLQSATQSVEAEGHSLARVIGEIVFSAPTNAAALRELVHSCMWCLEAQRVQVEELCLARDGRRAIVLFRAPDAESVRLACRKAELHFERVWTCAGPPDAAHEDLQPLGKPGAAPRPQR